MPAGSEALLAPTTPAQLEARPSAVGARR